jgi:hypothetical protein
MIIIFIISQIIPVENRYKRGRWQCWDYYEGGDLMKKGANILPSSIKPKGKSTKVKGAQGKIAIRRGDLLR